MGISKTKRLLALFTSVMLLTLVACNNSSGSSDPDKEDEKPDTTTTTPSNTPTPIPDGGTSVDDPIKLTFSIPAGTDNIEIQRRTVNESRKPTGEFYSILYKELYKEPDYNTKRDLTFTDIYGFIKDSCYEYRIILNQDWDNISSTQNQFIKAGYNGLVRPEFKVTNNAYPDIKYYQDQHAFKLNNKNDVDFDFKNNEKCEYWEIELSYNNRTWINFNKYSNSPYSEPTSLRDSLDTGINKLTYVALRFYFDGDEVTRIFPYSVDEIDNNKIGKTVFKNPEAFYESSNPNNNNSYIYIKFEWPEEAREKRLEELNIQRRPTSQQNWDVDLDKDRVGFLDGEDIVTRSKEGIFEFKDKYNFEDHADYDYRVVFLYRDNDNDQNWKTGVMPLGTEKTLTKGKDWDLDAEPSITYENDELTIEAYRHFKSGNALLPITESTQKVSVFLLCKNKWGDGGFYPTFTYDLKGGNSVTSARVEGLGDNYKLNVVQFNIRFYEEGECIAQSIEPSNTISCIDWEKGSAPTK